MSDAQGNALVSAGTLSPKIRLARSGNLLATRQGEDSPTLFTPEGYPLAHINIPVFTDALQQTDVSPGAEFLVSAEGGDIYYYNGEGGDRRKIFDNGSDPSLSADSSALVFAQGDTVVLGGMDSVAQHIVDPADTDPLFDPALSRNRDWIVMMSCVSRSSGGKLLLYEVGTSTEQLVSTEYWQHPTFSPDGDELVWTESNQLWTTSLISALAGPYTNMMFWARGIGVSPGVQELKPSFSADGSKLFYLETVATNPPAALVEIDFITGLEINRFGVLESNLLKWVP